LILFQAGQAGIQEGCGELDPPALIHQILHCDGAYAIGAVVFQADILDDGALEDGIDVV